MFYRSKLAPKSSRKILFFWNLLFGKRNILHHCVAINLTVLKYFNYKRSSLNFFSSCLRQFLLKYQEDYIWLELYFMILFCWPKRTVFEENCMLWFYSTDPSTWIDFSNINIHSVISWSVPKQTRNKEIALFAIFQIKTFNLNAVLRLFSHMRKPGEIILCHPLMIFFKQLEREVKNISIFS